METASPAVPATNEAATPTLKPALIIGAAVAVAFFDGKHVVRAQVGHVLSIGPNDENGFPTITVAYPNLPADGRKLGSARWYEGYVRQTGIYHVSNALVQDGKQSAAWAFVDVETENAPDLPQPEGDGQNPIFTRNVIDTPADPTAEALNAQKGQVPEGAHVSPVISEAGEAHDAVVQPAETTGATGSAPTTTTEAPAATEGETATS